MVEDTIPASTAEERAADSEARGGGEKPRRSMVKRALKHGERILAVIGAVSTVVGGYTAIKSLAGTEVAYQPGQAYVFVRDYLTLAPSDPDLARSTLTTNAFQQLQAVAGPDYATWWKSVRSVDLQHVGLTPEKNWFTVNYQLTYKDGHTEPIRAEWLVTCSDWVRRYVPFTHCSGHDLRLVDVTGPLRG